MELNEKEINEKEENKNKLINVRKLAGKLIALKYKYISL